ncbi:sulfite exporter TauE/SafE family protein [Microvirga arabica]|uniref:sulfite exporter TauE/SafE family protein n=1 Tax=Microvirga arabica TaxID=1128671 RepID=UPI0019393F43|nr:sulfite exporter TauE/SafE family protein [Microvirga arabica]MBM1174786.1 sulfite exporter TauE/SafE family protein [Microvirga arabica]
MLDFALWPILSIGLTFFLAGVVKGVTGMGLPTVAMGLLGAFMSPVAAAGLLIVPSFVTNVWQLASGPSFTALVSRFWLMMLGIVLGTVGSASILAGGDVQWTTAGLGTALVIYAVFTLLARQLSVPVEVEKWLSPLIGLTTGMVTGGTGVFVIPAVPYLQALGLSKDDLIQGLGLSFTVSTIALAAGLAWRGALQVDGLAMSSLAIAPALLGMWLGQAIRSRVSPVAFRRWFLICLMLLGIELILRSIL